MKNLSNVDIEEFLSRCERSRVENRTLEYNGKSYAIPYSTIKIQGEKINGLRENEERIALFEKFIEENSKSRKTYLDIGCNLGIFVKSYDHIFESVQGIDYDDYYIKQCKFLYPEIETSFIHDDINKNRLSDIVGDKKDVITALSMIEYIDNKENFIEDLYNLTNELCIIEGHSEDIIKGLDTYYERLINEQDWLVERVKETTDVGVNAPLNTFPTGRPVWICKKQ